MSPKQSIVVAHLRQHNRITLREAVGLIGGDVYCNRSFHVGNVLSNMVKRGMLVRVKRGVFELPPVTVEPPLQLS